MAWRKTRRPDDRPHRPDAQNVLARLDTAVDRLEGAYARFEDMTPLIEQYAASLERQREGR